ncbi:RNA polymerase sigma factor [Clostridium tarantellae]|uniref:Sigma-70 family RNA polymerase sigma factor n=1 Tax=Clostridium tarantellae TaxID=39493 RepID=A0A6I1MPM6_9CLOT|nr:sigma-70 family RNA polymerase sigma factor [Clostridium tarantellae]MPQ44870.1 sigma-70 family RNA polymerase sigma factor [Clostridium tarantellae]
MNTTNVFHIGFFRNKYKNKPIEKRKSNITLAIEGDKEAFNILIQENLNALYIVARGILNNEYDIEDAFQNTIINAYEHITSLKHEKYFKTWLTRIMINECNNIIRKNSKILYMEDSRIKEKYYENNIKNLDLMEAINALNNDLKITTWLFYFKDMSIEEISDTLGIAKGTVKSRLSRARQKLYTIMKGEN